MGKLDLIPQSSKPAAGECFVCNREAGETAGYGWDYERYFFKDPRIH